MINSDHHCGVGSSKPQRFYLSGAVGRAPGSTVVSYLLGGAGGGVGQHYGISDGCAGALRLWPGHGQLAFRQTQRTEGEEAARTW